MMHDDEDNIGNYISPAPSLDNYRTRDLYEAAVIHAFKLPILKVERDEGICHFVFANRELCEKLAMDFRNRELTVNAKGFIESLKTMKDFIYNGERRQ